MNIEMKDLLSFVTLAVDAGVQSYMRSVEPLQDHIKLSEAKRYVSKLGFQPVMIRKWTDAQLLTPIKAGDSQNAAVFYSLAEIKKLISSLRLKSITNEADHDKNI